MSKWPRVSRDKTPHNNTTHYCKFSLILFNNIINNESREFPDKFSPTVFLTISGKEYTAMIVLISDIYIDTNLY